MKEHGLSDAALTERRELAREIARGHVPGYDDLKFDIATISTVLVVSGDVTGHGAAGGELAITSWEGGFAAAAAGYHVVNLSGEHLKDSVDGAEHFDFGHGRGMDVEVYEDAVDAVLEHIGVGHKVALHCNMGMERAPLVAGGVMLALGMPSREEAMAKMRGIRPIVLDCWSWLG